MLFRTKSWLYAATVALACVCVSCEGDDPEEPYVPDDGGSAPALVVSPNYLVFDGAGETKSVTISNSTAAITYSGPEWIQISQSSGTVFSLTALENTTAKKRDGFVYFSSGSRSVAVSVSQDRKGTSGSDPNPNPNPDPNPDPNPGGNTSIPAAPTGLYATPDGPSSAPFAMLRWNQVSNATSYIVFRSNSAGGSYSRIGTSTVASYSDETVKYGNTYYYKIKASNSYGTSDYSDYAECSFTDTRKPGPVTYGNCTVSGTTMTLRWSVPNDPSYGKPTKAILRVRNPESGIYADVETLSGTATSVSFAYLPWVDKDGYVYAGIVLENEYGTGGGLPKVYDTNNKRWVN